MKKQISLDTRPDAYGPFFVDDFAEKAFEYSSDVRELRAIAFDLVADWRSASYAGALPAQIPAAVKRFHDAFVNNVDNDSGVMKFAEVIIAKVSRELPELAGAPDLVRKLRERLIKTGAEITDIAARTRSELDLDQVWREYLALHPFQLGLHGTMRLVFVGVYSAYENFLVRMLSLVEGGARVRITDWKDFKKRFRGHFGSLTEAALVSDEINQFKLVRHALVHAGARITPDLAKQKHIPAVVHDGALHIYPEHVRHLYQTLRTPALELLRAPCFRTARRNTVPPTA